MGIEILVLRGGGLGDTLLSIPAVSALRRKCVPCQITWAGNPSYLLTIPLGLQVEGLRSIEGPDFALLHAEDMTGAELLARFGRRNPFDLIVAWSSGQGTFKRNLRTLGKQVLLASPHPPQEGPPLHSSDHFLKTLASLDVPQGDIVLKLLPSEADFEEASRQLKDMGIDGRSDYLVIHPGGGGQRKCWPLQRFISLAQGFSPETPLLWILGPAEAKTLQRRLLDSLGTEARLMIEPPLPCLAAILARSRCYVGNDSGVTHLAAGVGAPVVALFGPTDPRIWGPRGKWTLTLRRAEGCRACAGLTDQRDHTCLEALSVDEIRAAVKKQGEGSLAGEGRRPVRKI